ncbi:host specificity factor TipJ family phage tail protein [Serratia fonticola]|uniref:host specificity factor TipJ family phage tail protein n=1 Tax=Serratia fonticola TaxID=47917 RepID=UPI003AAF3DBE
MTIRIYPSRLPGEPLETHEHGAMTVHQWLVDNVYGYKVEMRHPVAVEVNGKPITPSDWQICRISAESDVRIYPIPYAIGAATAMWIAAAVAVAAAAYSLYMMNQMKGDGAASVSNGDQLDLTAAKANTAKLGEPIREPLGMNRIYPDYLVQPVSRFDHDNPQIYRSYLFLSIGNGNLAINPSEIRLGNTSVAAFGDDISYTIYPPGADVSGEARSENWFAAPEVGGTASGTAGLDLASTGPASVSVSSDAIVVSGNAITVLSTGSPELPETWQAGTVITVVAPDTYTVSAAGGGNVIYGDFTELNPSVGLPVSLTWNNTRFDLFISAYNPGSPAVPGVGGNAAIITASAAPTTYDFSTAPVSFTLTWASVPYVISLSANYVTMAGLIDEITDQLVGSALIADQNAGRLVIREKESPFSGDSITYSLLPVSLFGAAPVIVAGVASTGGSPAVTPSIALAWGSVSGSAFGGIPNGQQRIAIGLKGYQYRITDISGLTLTLERLIQVIDNTVTVDPAWPGFTTRTLLDATVTGLNTNDDWMGPFLCTPSNEKTSTVELNFAYPQGLCDVGSKDGAIHWHDVVIAVQYREYGTTDWFTVQIAHGNNTVNEIGYTETINFPALATYEIRVKRETPVWGGTTRDSVQWQAMRAELTARPVRYEGITTLGITVRTGSRLAAQSDRRVNIIGTRLYDGYPSRSISGALYHVMKSLGFTDSQIDYATIDALESTYWTPRGETFDYSADSSGMSALNILQKITNAGMGYFLLSDGLASAGREGIKPWVGIISPQEQTEELTTGFSAHSQDDYDGVDVTYINGTTWAEETVQCRTVDNPTPLKVENYKLDGVLDQDRAYRIGMRRLMGYKYQRLTHSTATEMDAMCYQYMDRIIMTDDIPGTNTISCLVIGMSYTASLITLEVSEPLDWTFVNPRVLIRYQDGSASGLLVPTQIDDYTLTIPYSSTISPESWVMDSGAIEPPRLIFCSSSRIGYETMLSEIAPNSDGTCQVSAIQYTPLKYQYDDAVYPGDVQ